jgi:predicted transcriptional regulator
LPRKKSATLTEAELRLMNVLWDRGAATVGEVTEAMTGKSALAYSTVLTTMRILEQKGYIRHEQRGRAFVYEPLVDRQTASRSALRQLMSRFFDNSPGLLVLNVLEDEEIDAKELKRLRALINKADEE